MSTIAKIHRIGVESGRAGNRFILTLVHIAAAIAPATEGKPTYATFSVPLSSTDSVRIGKQQLRNAIPALMGVADPMQELLVHRSKYIGTEVAYITVPQVDDNGQPKRNPDGVQYVNVRLEPSSADLTPEQAAALLAAPASDDDIPM